MGSHCPDPFREGGGPIPFILPFLIASALHLSLALTLLPVFREVEEGGKRVRIKVIKGEEGREEEPPKEEGRRAEKERPPPPRSLKKPPPPFPTWRSGDPSSEPVKEVFGLNPESFAKGDSSLSAPAGNTLMKEPDPVPRPMEEVKPLPPTLHDLSALSTMPVKVLDSPAAYPEGARRLGITGKVFLEIVVSERGEVISSRVMSGPGHGLDEAARRASLGLRFRPATMDGRRVAVRIIYTYTFSLE